MRKTVFGTAEWAVANANYLNGCSNDCKYCYSKDMAIRFKRETPDTWKEEEVNWTAYNKIIRGKRGYIMFPSTHDITPKHLDLAISYLARLLLYGNSVLIVTKPSLECIKSICDTFTDYKEQILFRFTIGSVDSNTLKFWEPYAPDYSERKQSLIYAYYAGFKTSISCEPMLDNNIQAVIEDLSKYVTDAIWLGKMNFVLRRLRTNGHTDELTLKAANQILSWQSDDEIEALYNKYKDNPMIKWKESIKKVVGLDISVVKGEDK